MQAGMSTVEFEDYFYDVCLNVDYSAMRAAMEKAKTYLDTVDQVRIVGKGTDISFSVKGMPWIPCSGEANIPDGEIYSCPLRESVNGKIAYTCKSTYQGHCFSDVSFVFRDGRIVEAHADDDMLLNKVLDTDEGARYIGEFSLGCNPQVTVPIDNILFDEKIKGSIHFTPGQSYHDCFNGNNSAVHWDLVQIQREGYAEAKIFFDGVLVRDNGVFVHPELEGLNFGQ
jgi:aminopeptidase